jgi:electron transfer flavoprotein-quinone oxidoreductase
MVLASDVDFDVIVVGAGIAGCVTAYQLASQGRSVLLAERGPAAGSKTLSGGILYCRVMEQVFPGFATEVPVERRIVRNCLSFLTPTSFVNVDYRDERLAEPVNAVTVLRARLDDWLAAKCEAAGATVMAGVRVDSLLTDGERIVGIKAGEDELRAHVVVAADGVNSFLCRDAGIRGKEPTNHLAVGVKSVIGLPRSVIDDRFNLRGDEGAAYAVVGDCTNGVGGGGFMYTNRESISIGIVARLDDLARSGESSSGLHDRFLGHPAIARFLDGGELLEYGCHLVAEGGQAMVHDLVRDGLVVVGDAAGLTLNTGLTVRGMDLAAGSAIAAAKVIDAAIDADDVSRAALEAYPVELDRSFVGRDLRTYAKAPAFLENPRLYRDYGPLLADLMHGVFNLDTRPRRHLVRTALTAQRRSPLGLARLARDAFAGVRAP